MEYIEKLTEQQQKVFDVMLNMIESKQNYLLSSEDRNIGKTITLNELAFTLQSLGYDVCLLSPYPHEFYANRFISFNEIDYASKIYDDTIIVADEAKVEMMDELFDYCKNRNIPIVGYVNFYSRIPVMYDNKEKFKREYEFTWNMDLIKNFKF